VKPSGARRKSGLNSLYERVKDSEDEEESSQVQRTSATSWNLLNVNTDPVAPSGQIDLEREAKRHEVDEGRARSYSAGRRHSPHLEGSHMEYVEAKTHASTWKTAYRPPVGPSSRDNTPGGLLEKPPAIPVQVGSKVSEERDVFCCRHSEAEMMIEV